MSAEYTRRNSDPGAVATPPAASVASPRPWPALFIAAFLVLMAGLLLARPLAAAYYLGAGGRSLEAARGSAEPAAHLGLAAAHLERARALSPEEPLVYRRLAEVATLSGRPAEAAAALETALGLEPKSLLIRRELMYAYIDAGRLDVAATLLAELRGGAVDLMDVADMELRSGDLQRAYATYRGLIAVSERPRPEWLVGAGLTAAALGETAEAARLLRDSGAPEPVNVILDAVAAEVAHTGALFPPDVRVNGRLQALNGESALLILGQGWYSVDTGFGRWASSPAELLIFLPRAQRVQLDLLVVLLHEPAAQNGMGAAGSLLVSTHNSTVLRAEVSAQQDNRLEFDLPAGWSRVTLQLDAGNFQPQAYDELSGDSRSLSFALSDMNLITAP